MTGSDSKLETRITFFYDLDLEKYVSSFETTNCETGYTSGIRLHFDTYSEVLDYIARLWVQGLLTF